jgi:hypothetical protein
VFLKDVPDSLPKMLPIAFVHRCCHKAANFQT